MATKSIGTTLPNYARLSGLGYLGVIIFGVYAELIARSKLIVPGDPAATVGNIQASEFLFRSAFVSDLLMLAAYVFLGFALFMLIRPGREDLAVLFGFFHIVGATMMGVNMLNPYSIQVLLENAAGVAALGEDHLHAQVAYFLDMHNQGYLAAQMMFVPWALILGYAFFVSGYVPKFFGVLFTLGGLGYLIECLVGFLFPEYRAAVAEIVILPMTVAEFGICLWFLFMGGRVHQAYLAQA